MNCLIVLCALMAAAAAVPQFGAARKPYKAQPAFRPQPAAPKYSASAGAGGGANAAILRQASDVNPDGSYSYSYETDNGISADEQGQPAGEGLAVSGSYRYTAPDGTPIEVTYVSGENGFEPQGAHIPQIPPQIARALEYIRAHPQQDEGVGVAKFQPSRQPSRPAFNKYGRR